MRGKNKVVRARADAYLKQFGRLTISVITVLEVAKGLRKVQREDALDRFTEGLESLEIIPLGCEEALIGVESTATSNGSDSRSVEPIR